MHKPPHSFLISLLLLCSVLFAACSEDEKETPTPAPTPLLSHYELEGDSLHPEGVAFDPTTRSFLFGSLTEGNIHLVSHDGQMDLFAPAPEEEWGSLGLALDTNQRTLWVCAGPLSNEGADALWRFNADTGEHLDTLSLESADPSAQCNDVIVDNDGSAFVTDPSLGRLYKITTDGDITTFSQGDVFAPALSGAGPNGLAMTPQGNAIIVGTLLPASLIVVPMDDPQNPYPLDLSGDPLTPTEGVGGPDGLIFHRDALAVIIDDGVLRVELSQDLRSGTVTRINTEGLDGLSTATIAEEELYVIKSEVVALLFGQEPDLPFAISHVDQWP